VRTFNSEFCANTGSFLASTGGYAFDYVTNSFEQSLANQLKNLGYSAKTYHYNDPNFYSRGVFEPAMGYDEYVCYADYADPEDKWALYDEEFLFNQEQIAQDFLRDGPKLNYIITRSAHLSYKYNEMLSYYALQQHPQYKGLTGHEEEDCMYVKARLVDDLFARLIAELEADGELENTVIVAFTDHYTYGMDDQQLVWDRSGVDDTLLVEKTPCFIWTPGGPSMEVTKTLNTADLLPTVLNLMGVDSRYHYMGQDAFDPNYPGYALFPNGSWVSQGIAYNVSGNRLMILSDDAPEATEEFRKEMSDTLMEFIRINNLILESDYYSN
jgi:phosphoglycerol transferase MdoB-like AlkP superfamily enzyme